MKIYLGADHRGFELKEHVKKWLEEEGHEPIDMGAYEMDPDDDYPDFAVKVSKGVVGNGRARGILFCGSGHGMDIVANRFKEVRSIIGFNENVVIQGREHEDANVLTLPTDWVGKEDSVEYVRLFLITNPSESVRHMRRLDKMAKVGD